MLMTGPPKGWPTIRTCGSRTWCSSMVTVRSKPGASMKSRLAARRPERRLQRFEQRQRPAHVDAHRLARRRRPSRIERASASSERFCRSSLTRPPTMRATVAATRSRRRAPPWRRCAARPPCRHRRRSVSRKALASSALAWRSASSAASCASDRRVPRARPRPGRPPRRSARRYRPAAPEHPAVCGSDVDLRLARRAARARRNPAAGRKGLPRPWHQPRLPGPPICAGSARCAPH